jgi:hypothetical protein
MYDKANLERSASCPRFHNAEQKSLPQNKKQSCFRSTGFVINHIKLVFLNVECVQVLHVIANKKSIYYKHSNVTCSTVFEEYKLHSQSIRLHCYGKSEICVYRKKAAYDGTCFVITHTELRSVIIFSVVYRVKATYVIDATTTTTY